MSILERFFKTNQTVFTQIFSLCS